MYKCAGEALLSPEVDAQLKQVRPEDIVGHCSRLRPDDILVSNFCLNYGCGAKNPVDQVFFYNSSNPGILMCDKGV